MWAAWGDYTIALSRESAGLPAAEAAEFGLQLAGAGFGLDAGGLLPVGAGAFVLEGYDVLAGGWVVPAQLPRFPAQVQVQRWAVALQRSVGSRSMGMGRYWPSGERRSPASLTRRGSSVSSKRQYSGMPKLA